MEYSKQTVIEVLEQSIEKTKDEMERELEGLRNE